VNNGASLFKQTKVLGARWCGNTTKQHRNHHRDDATVKTTQFKPLITHQNVVKVNNILKKKNTFWCRIILWDDVMSSFVLSM
jgi:hypothetical protein